MPIDATLYDSTILLVRGACTLSPATQPTQGSMVVGKTPDLLSYRSLTLQLPNGKQLSVVPRRMEYAAGKAAVLVFDVER